MGLSLRAFKGFGVEPSTRGLTLRVIRITPELALEFLTFNARNRKKKKKFISELAAQIKAGGYVLNGETIIFSDEGFLLDGQNRLRGIIASSQSAECLVVYGIKPSAQKTIDTGNKRSGADWLTILGIPNASELAKMTRTMFAYANGTFYTDKVPTVQPGDTEDIVNAFPEFAESTTITRCTRDIATHADMAFLHVLMSQVNKKLADAFMTQLGKGEGLDKSSPVYKLRKAMIRAIARGNGKKSLPRPLQRAWVIKAWEATREGVKQITFGRDDDQLEVEITGVPTAFKKRCNEFEQEVIIIEEEPVAV